MDHVTAVFMLLVTAAVNCWVWPPVEIETGDGETDTVTGGVKLTVAVPAFVALATLVAVTVTVCVEVMEAGAVYCPAEEIEPTAGLMDHVTVVLEALATVAVNC